MKIFAIADLHLSFHENIDKPMSIFGAGWEDYEKRLSDYWHELISPEDVVILPGDLSWGLSLEEALPDLEWIHRLPGRKVLLKGNHDLWWSRITYLNTLYEDIHFLQNDCVLLTEEETGGERIAICGSRGWVLPGSLASLLPHPVKTPRSIAPATRILANFFMLFSFFHFFTVDFVYMLIKPQEA